MSFNIKYFLNKKTFYVLLSLFFIECLSFLSFFYPNLREVIFFTLVLGVLILAIKDLKYAFYIILLEIVIASHGYLFFTEIFGGQISLRMAFWFIVIAVWFIKWIKWLYKYLNTAEEERENASLSYHFRYFGVFLLLAIFVFIASLKGFIVSDNISVWFNDFNAWLYFFLLLPAIAIFRRNNINTLIKDLSILFSAGVIWLAIKTLILLFLFSHELTVIEFVYEWSRDYLLAEITVLPDGFYRIFFQSHIYIALALIFSWLVILNKKLSRKKLFIIIAISALLLSAILLSLSRSIWLGLAFVSLIYLIYLIKSFKGKELFLNIIKVLSSIILAFIFIIAVIEIPLPGYSQNINAGKTFRDRANISNQNEAAVSSRWSLLPVMLEEIIRAPIIGYGFGKELTYKSQDPRILETDDSGVYTTYAFEWGWLSLWLKMGILGVLAYVWLLYRVVCDAFKTKKWQPYMRALGFGLIFLTVVNFFTPYFNHPLAILFLIISSLVVAASKDYYLNR